MRERAKYGENGVLKITFLENPTLLLAKSNACLLKKKIPIPHAVPLKSIENKLYRMEIDQICVSKT